MSGTECAPLLLGSTQFGTLTNAHHQLIMVELSVSNYGFHTHIIDYRGKEVANGINYLEKLLK